MLNAFIRLLQPISTLLLLISNRAASFTFFRHQEKEKIIGKKINEKAEKLVYKKKTKRISHFYLIFHILPSPFPLHFPVIHLLTAVILFSPGNTTFIGDLFFSKFFSFEFQKHTNKQEAAFNADK